MSFLSLNGLESRLLEVILGRSEHRTFGFIWSDLVRSVLISPHTDHNWDTGRFYLPCTFPTFHLLFFFFLISVGFNFCTNYLAFGESLTWLWAGLASPATPHSVQLGLLYDLWRGMRYFSGQTQRGSFQSRVHWTKGDVKSGQDDCDQGYVKLWSEISTLVHNAVSVVAWNDDHWWVMAALQCVLAWRFWVRLQANQPRLTSG